MIQLNNPYISVSDGITASYGGNQMRSTDKTERMVGCGVVAGLDLMLYLSRYHKAAAQINLKLPLPQAWPMELQLYLSLLHQLRKKYLPLIPGHGINGLSIALGINACFIKNRMPYTAIWGVPYSKLWTAIEHMLDEDIPVIFSIGPNFPLFWQHHKLRFYYQRTDGAFVPGPQTHAHYVTITGMDEQWLQIASWGKKYYIKKSEYIDYVRHHSIRLVSNILYIRKKSRGVS